MPRAEVVERGQGAVAERDRGAQVGEAAQVLGGPGADSSVVEQGSAVANATRRMASAPNSSPDAGRNDGPTPNGNTSAPAASLPSAD